MVQALLLKYIVGRRGQTSTEAESNTFVCVCAYLFSDLTL